jgi:hypothetical protein
MFWGHFVAIESYPQTLVAWGEVMLHYGYPRDGTETGVNMIRD